MNFISPRRFHSLPRPFLVAFLGLALLFKSAPVRADEDNESKRREVWTAVFGAPIAGVVIASISALPAGITVSVVKPTAFIKSPQKVKSAMATMNAQASGVANDDIRQIAISTTMDTGGDTVFGLTGADVPVTVILLMRPGNPSQLYTQGQVVGGQTLVDDFVGYPADQIVAFYHRVGDLDGTGDEVTWVNPASNPAFVNPALTFPDVSLPDGAAAKVWLNGDLRTVNPTAMALRANVGGGNYFVGSFTGLGPPTLDYYENVLIGDGGHFGDGPIGPIEVTDVSGEVADFLARARRAANDLLKAHKASDSADRLARKKGKRPTRFPPAKRAERKVVKEAKDFVEFLERPIVP